MLFRDIMKMMNWSKTANHNPNPIYRRSGLPNPNDNVLKFRRTNPPSPNEKADKGPLGQKPCRSEALPTLFKLRRWCRTWHLFTSGPPTDIGIIAVSFVQIRRLDELWAGLEPSLSRIWLSVNQLPLTSASSFIIGIGAVSFAGTRWALSIPFAPIVARGSFSRIRNYS